MNSRERVIAEFAGPDIHHSALGTERKPRIWT